jgi:hypothetical protein
MNTAAFILIIFAHVGPMGSGNSNAITTAPFSTEQACKAAGEAMKAIARGTVKIIEYHCAKTS